MLKRFKREIKEGKTFLQFGLLKALGQSLGMVSPLLVASYFSEELFSSYSLARMIVFFCSMLFVRSLQVPFIVFASEERLETGKINKTFTIQLSLLLACLIILSLAMMLFRKQIVFFAKISSAELPFLLIAFIGIAAKTFSCNLFIALDQKIKNAFAELFFGIATLFLIFTFHILNILSIRTAFLTYFLSGILLLIPFAKTIDLKLLFPLRFSYSHLLKIFEFTRWQVLGLTSVYFVNWGANLLLRFYVPFEEIGTFNLAYSFFKGLTTLMSAIGVYFLPFISFNINQPIKIKDYLFRKRPKIIASGVAVIASCYVMIPLLFNIIYSGRYPGCSMIIRILLVASFSILYNIFYQPIFNALKMFRYVQWINIGHVVTTLILTFLLVRPFGIKGAAIASLIGFMLRTLGYEICFKKIAKGKLGI